MGSIRHSSAAASTSATPYVASGRPTAFCAAPLPGESGGEGEAAVCVCVCVCVCV